MSTTYKTSKQRLSFIIEIEATRLANRFGKTEIDENDISAIYGQLKPDEKTLVSLDELGSTIRHKVKTLRST